MICTIKISATAASSWRAMQCQQGFLHIRPPNKCCCDEQQWSLLHASMWHPDHNTAESICAILSQGVSVVGCMCKMVLKNLALATRSTGCKTRTPATWNPLPLWMCTQTVQITNLALKEPSARWKCTVIGNAHARQKLHRRNSQSCALLTKEK